MMNFSRVRVSVNWKLSFFSQMKKTKQNLCSPVGSSDAHCFTTTIFQMWARGATFLLATRRRLTIAHFGYGLMVVVVVVVVCVCVCVCVSNTLMECQLYHKNEFNIVYAISHLNAYQFLNNRNQKHSNSTTVQSAALWQVYSSKSPLYEWPCKCNQRPTKWTRLFP